VRGERLDEFVVNALLHEHACACGAVLTGVVVTGERHALYGSVYVGVVEDDDGCFAAEFEVHALDVATR
jgi:hypothetical protein